MPYHCLHIMDSALHLFLVNQCVLQGYSYLLLTVSYRAGTLQTLSPCSLHTPYPRLLKWFPQKYNLPDSYIPMYLPSSFQALHIHALSFRYPDILYSGHSALLILSAEFLCILSTYFFAAFFRSSFLPRSLSIKIVSPFTEYIQQEKRMYYKKILYFFIVLSNIKCVFSPYKIAKNYRSFFTIDNFFL